MKRVYLTLSMADEIVFGHKPCMGSSRIPEQACYCNRLTMIIVKQKLKVRAWIGDHPGQGLVLDQNSTKILIQ